jgi:CRP-like cAMP-binding protein
MPERDNLLLASLAPNDLAALRPHLKPIHLEQQQVLLAPGDLTRDVYFPTSAIVSLVVGLSTGEMIEAAMVGKDGVIGASAALDSKVSLSRAVVQLDGSAFTCEAGALKHAAIQSVPLLSILIRHEQTLYSQVQQSVACMAAHHTEGRLCRWLLRARDLSGSDTLNFTQEFLAQMLGLQRASVTVVAHTLQQAGMIRYSRGKIHVTNVDGLRDAACECYETVNAQYEALLNPGA